jgi:lipoyl(octanoyl) transferase
VYFILVLDLKKTTELKSTNSFFSCDYRYLGKISYVEALNIQLDCIEKVKTNFKNIVIGLEHPSVLTLGYRASELGEVLPLNNIPVVKIERGGLATIHSEGQLVIYPIVHLKALKLGVRTYVEILLESTREMLSLLGIVTLEPAQKAVGLYTEKGKIAFCGIQVKEGVSFHGISINVSNDLKLFSSIVACGIKSQKLDKISNHSPETENLKDLFSLWSQCFNHNMNSQQERLQNY